MLCATISDLTAQLRQTLWRQERPAILTSATLAVGEDFRRFNEETGLHTDSRVTGSVAPSPFDYQRKWENSRSPPLLAWMSGMSRRSIKF